MTKTALAFDDDGESLSYHSFFTQTTTGAIAFNSDYSLNWTGSPGFTFNYLIPNNNVWIINDSQ